MILVAADAGASTALAHHSAAMYDREKIISVTGTIKLFEYTNPHSAIQLIATERGKQVEWDFEGEAPSLLMRAGIHLHTLKPGDTVTITAHPMKQGGSTGQLISVTAADGKTYSPGGGGSLAPPPS